MVLLVPTYSTEYGVTVKTFPEVSKGIRFNATFRTFGGTEITVNGAYSVEDTATIETWFMPQMKSDCRVVNMLTGNVYEVLGTPENIEGRNQYIMARLKAIKGGA